jgi:uncharacterized membrane protein
MKFSKKERELLDLCLHEIEARTCAEVVLVVRKWSGNYRDVNYLFGAFAAWLSLMIVLSVPAEIPDTWIPLPLIFVFWAAAAVSQRTYLKKWLTFRKRRDLQVKRASHACFYEKKIHQTTAHSGILIYCSTLERQTEIVMDRAAVAALDAVKMEEFSQQFSGVCDAKNRFECLTQALRSFGVYLGQVLPVGAESTKHQLDYENEFDDAGDDV